MDKGLYLYCIRAKTDYKNLPAGRTLYVCPSGKPLTKFSVQGIDGGQVFAVPCQDLEAVVSEVSLKEFGSEEIQRKAQEDLKWIKEKAQLHEQVVEEAMKKGDEILSIIPMKFGTIFKTRENLEETLKKHYGQFRESLERLKGKQEWSVKVYLNRKNFEEEVKKVSKVVQEKEKEIDQLPEGIAYFMQKQIDEAVSKEADKAIENYTEDFFETLKKHAVAGIKGKILEKELTGKSLPMVLNAILLISEEKLEGFTKEIDKLNREYGTKGFNFEYTGPWPPYNFI
ncbi:MAG: GvpL/GvpF family gas vesicle protein [bacterium]